MNAQAPAQTNIAIYLVPAVAVVASLAWGAMQPDRALEAVLVAAFGVAAAACIRMAGLLRSAGHAARTHAERSNALMRQVELAQTAHASEKQRLHAEIEGLHAQLQVETTRRETAQRLALQTTHSDALTQLPNRTRLQEDLARPRQ